MNAMKSTNKKLKGKRKARGHRSLRKYEQAAKRGGGLASMEWLRMPGTTPLPAPEVRRAQLPRSSRQCGRHAKPGRTEPGNLRVAVADCRWILKLLDHLEEGRPLSARELTDLVLLMSTVIISIKSVAEEKYQDGWMNSSA